MYRERERERHTHTLIYLYIYTHICIHVLYLFYIYIYIERERERKRERERDYVYMYIYIYIYMYMCISSKAFKLQSLRPFVQIVCFATGCNTACTSTVSRTPPFDGFAVWLYSWLQSHLLKSMPHRE